MTDRLAGFKGEYLWELDITEHHLTALAAAIPADRYQWRPAEDARSVSEVVVHVAAGNFGLLDMIGIEAPRHIYDAAPREAGLARFLALIMKNQVLEKSMTAKAEVTSLLNASLAAVRAAFTGATAEDLDATGMFFGEQTTVRRAYLRILAHTHEHMGQLIGYVRVMGLKAPWPDPLLEVQALAAGASDAPR